MKEKIIEKKWQSSRGQGLIEYLILTCLLAVSTIAVVSIMGQNLRARYASISAALRGKKSPYELKEPKKDHIKIRGMSDFEKSAFETGR